MARSKTQYAILGLLAMGPKSGYDIHKTVQSALSHFWRESYGSIYPTLKRLHKEGLVAKRRPKRGGHPERTTFEITERGRDALQLWFDRAIVPAPSKDELLLKLYFGGFATPPSLRRQIESRRAAAEANLTRIRVIERRRDRRDRSPYGALTIALQRALYEASLTWCDEALAAIDEAERKQRDEDE